MRDFPEWSSCGLLLGPASAVSVSCDVTPGNAAWLCNPKVAAPNIVAIAITAIPLHLKLTAILHPLLYDNVHIMGPGPP